MDPVPPRRLDLSRRSLLRGALGAAALAAVPEPLRALRLPIGHAAPPASRALEWLDAARAAERWIRSHRRAADDGVLWAWNPEEAEPEVATSLYSGTPGVVLFYLELHAATGDAAYLDEAARGADALLARLPTLEAAGDAGLYTGLAGVGYTLAEAARSTGAPRHREGARRALRWIEREARTADGGVAWNESTDIISGAAGILLWLLRAAPELDAGDVLPLAARAGRRLAALGRRAEGGGLKWAISPEVEREYPNFSHGAAGVAYALATLHQATGDAEALDAALAGAAYLRAIADRDAGCKVLHHRPGGEDLYYLSWCHGPAGTARLWRRLEAISGDPAWRTEIDCGARGTLAMGAPVARSPGYWENVGACCGNAGVGEFFVALHGEAGDEAHLGAARDAAADILARATPAGDGLKWLQAEHRVRPEWRVAQTGLMQGAAGVGLFLLHLAAAEAGRPRRIILPDDPWG